MTVEILHCLLCIIPLGALGATAETSRPVRLGSPVTHSDWMLRDPAPAWGPEGVRQILDRCRECGLTRVYWRCFDGGRALYPSKVVEPCRGFDDDNYHRSHGTTWVLDKLAPLDFGSYDALAEAIRYGRSVGLEVHAWLTINEDDHGWGLISRFSREHPELRWVQRDGRIYRSQLSFGFPQVRAYKLALVREIMAYAPDGIFFDWIRTGDVRDNPHTDRDGVALHGYEAPYVREFIRRYNQDPREVPNGDPRWVQVRAFGQTQFMREARAIIKAANPSAVISIMTHAPWGYRGQPDDTPYDGSLRGLLCDVRTWAKDGLMDEAVAAGYYRAGGSAEAAVRWLRDETEGNVAVWQYGWISSPEQFRADTALAEKLGVAELLLWESDYLQMPPANAALVETMRRYSGR